MISLFYIVCVDFKASQGERIRRTEIVFKEAGHASAFRLLTVLSAWQGSPVFAERRTDPCRIDARCFRPPSPRKGLRWGEKG